jgi:Icc-related predicted phosphoesterase
MTTFVAISDMHGTLLHPAEMPEGDVLLIGGDVCPLWDHNHGFQARWLRSEFSEWLTALDYKAIFGVGGNHDFVLADSNVGSELPWTYLEGTDAEYEGFKIHGSPMSNRFGHWAFMAGEGTLKNAHWNKIPDDTNILITHGPPYGYGDRLAPKNIHNAQDPHVGSPSLARRVQELKDLRLHTFGHIHEAYGSYGGSMFGSDAEIRKIPLSINTSYCDENYTKYNKPVVVVIP